MTTPTQNNKASGLLMYGIGWCILMALMVAAFNEWQTAREHPNRALNSSSGPLHLAANYQNHFVVDGAINGVSTTFLIDTGATDVVIPMAHAKAIGLKVGSAATAMTANGPITVYRSTISDLNIGHLKLNDISASINPAMKGNSALLGMSALKWFNLEQQGSELIISQ